MSGIPGVPNTALSGMLTYKLGVVEKRLMEVIFFATPMNCLDLFTAHSLLPLPSLLPSLPHPPLFAKSVPCGDRRPCVGAPLAGEISICDLAGEGEVFGTRHSMGLALQVNLSFTRMTYPDTPWDWQIYPHPNGPRSILTYMECLNMDAEEQAIERGSSGFRTLAGRPGARWMPRPEDQA